MKSIKHISFAIVLALSTIVTSCSSDGGGGGSSASAGTMKAKVGSTNWSSLSAATAATKQVTGSSTTIIVQGSDASGKAMQLMVIANIIAPGTYEISNASNTTNASYTEVNINNPAASQTWAAPYENSGVIGSITFTDITSTNVKGTFTFTGKNESGADTKQITNGAFNVNLTNQN